MTSFSISCIDATEDKSQTKIALQTTLDTLSKAGKHVDMVYWFSNTNLDKPNFRHTWIKIPKFNDYVEQYSAITLKLCPHICIQDFNFIIHADGYAVNPEAWTDEFLEYDYLGALWQDGICGNGGFSMRSRKLYDAIVAADIAFVKRDFQYIILDDPVFFSNFIVDGKYQLPEDTILCRIYRNTLINDFKIKFGEGEIANRFSIEHMTDSVWSGKSLGFHGKHGVAKLYGVEL
jgi:hypothetical protein